MEDANLSSGECWNVASFTALNKLFTKSCSELI